MKWTKIILLENIWLSLSLYNIGWICFLSFCFISKFWMIFLAMFLRMGKGGRFCLKAIKEGRISFYFTELSGISKNVQIFKIMKWWQNKSEFNTAFSEMWQMCSFLKEISMIYGMLFLLRRLLRMTLLLDYTRFSQISNLKSSVIITTHSLMRPTSFQE